MRLVYSLIVPAIILSACVQKEDVSEKLTRYGISPELLTRNLKDSDAEHFFNLTSTTINGEDTTTHVSTFDPTKGIGERWVLVSVNGDTPSGKELIDFNKTHNTKKRDINGRVDEGSWGIETDNETSLVFSFKYDKSSLPHKYSFLGECKGLAYYNKISERLEKAEFVNEKPIRIKMLSVEKLDMVVYFSYHEEEGHYLIHKEDLDMDVKLLGQMVPIREHNKYMNYRKIE